MYPALKSCSVILNRNSGVRETTKIDHFRTVEMTRFKEASCRSEISKCKASSSEVNKEKIHKLRKNKRVNYSDDINTECESSCSDFSNDSSSSDDEETAQEQKRSKKKLSCLLCDKSFSTHSSYLIHKRSHLQHPFKCILCIKGFVFRQSFMVHMKNHHPEIEPFLCEYPRCEKNFKTKKQLENHNKMHWRYMCKYCKKLFLKKYHMRKHVLRNH